MEFPNTGFVSAIIVAGGSGRRFGGDIRKQYLELGGCSVLGRTLRLFMGIYEVGEVVVVAPKDDVAYIRGELVPTELGSELAKPLSVVAGGRTRQESARAGLAAADERFETVIIHDAVRPFAEPLHVSQVIQQAREHGGAILAMHVKDTLKRGQAGFITGTTPRDGLYAAQTPQAFSLAKLRDAHETAAKRGLTVTDDAALFEALGYPVAIVEGSALNIKITTEEDMAMARAILGIRG